jgi:coenzyme F420 hydrogenase subunit beta
MRTRRRHLDQEIARVVESGNCSGCGMCTLLDAGLEMQLDASGYNRPLRVAQSLNSAEAVVRFRKACPGSQVEAQRPPHSVRHPTMGPVVAVWKAWATDTEVRFTGSSGGTLTALATWMMESGEAAEVVGARSDVANPRRTVSVQITTREAALASAGSRYGPVSNCANPGATNPAAAFIGKPCEVSALRALHKADRVGGGTLDGPVLLSFYCAGVPSQHATDSLVEELGVPADENISDLWYRGRGWPGRFTVVRRNNAVVDSTYDDSWGQHLGPTVQWRCKVCPDGVGESADITAADFWQTDDRGYPRFAESPGVSALIARTSRGFELVSRAIAAGVIEAIPINISELAAVQPLQRNRRETLGGRLVGTVIAGRAIPRYVGFSLTRLAARRIRTSFRTAKATYGRVKKRVS